MDGNASPYPGAFLESTGAAAAKVLTDLMEANSKFSFLRLGDGELGFLLHMQGSERDYARRDLGPSCEIAHGNPALTAKDYVRLLRSFECCSVIDLHSQLTYNAEHLGRLRWDRSSSTIGTASSGRTALLFTWVHHELRTYVSRHRSVFCGAEASLLRELLTDVEFRQAAAPYLPADSAIHFLQPRHDGVRVSEDLDDIKSDLAALVREQQIDTIFVSLGGGAKILCHELAEELGIRAIDFGSALRALTFSGSDGQAAWRSSHHPFLFRVPIHVYLRALRRAHPDIDPVTLIAKAHAQLCLELQHKVLLQATTSAANDGAMFDASGENLRNFKEAYAYYREHILPLGDSSAEASRLIAEFRHWRRKHGLGWDGRLFQLGVRAKSAVRRVFGART
jgi:hypothetical protein